VKNKALLLSILFTCALPALAARNEENHQGRRVAASQVIIQLRSDSADSLSRVVADADGDKAERLRGAQPVFLVRSRSKNVAGLLNALSRHPDVQLVEPDYILQASAVPNDPYYSNLWALGNTGQTILGAPGIAGADIRAQAAWDITKGSTANVVGIIDSGIDYNHPDLAPNVWTAPQAFTVTIGGTAITCPAGSHGFDAITRTCNPMDTNGHGTHVAGTIGAAGNNAAGVTGVNWVGSLLGLRMLDNSGSGTSSDAIAAIEFAVRVKALFGAAANVRVLSASWGGPGSSVSLRDAITSAGSSDMLFVAAAGNAGTNNDTTGFYPASFPLANVLSVAATDNQDGLAGFSNYGSTTVHLGAPGVSILSTAPGGGYVWMSGTSMATPHVSAAAALVLSKCALDTAGLRSVLLSSADRIGSLAGRTTSGARLNVYRALLACSGSTVPPPAAGATATFVKTDTTTGGNWKGVYGADGQSIAGDTQSYPSWATVTMTGLWAQHTWTASTADTRALQRSLSSDRVAACWFEPTTSYINVKVNDGATHRIALYMVDFDAANRLQKVELVDVTTGTVLDTRNVAGFSSGQYLVWDVSGNLQIRVVHTGTVNAVFSGLFFGGAGTTTTPPTPPPTTPTPVPGTSARFVQADTTTAGNWKGVYGADGYSIAADGQSYPAWAAVTQSTAWAPHTWTPSTSDTRALQRGTLAGRIASCWFQGATATWDVRVTDGGTHRLALYMVDFDALNRLQRVEIVDSGTGAVLDTRNVSGFAGGLYLVWDIAGSVRIRVVHTGTINAVVSGLFFGAAGSVPPPTTPSPSPSTSARFLQLDTTTSGSWKGVYGSGGRTIAGDTPVNPAWGSVTVSPLWVPYTWYPTTTDTRALQRGTGPDRLATCWFHPATATFDVKITDGALHRAALYVVDFDGLSRLERVDLVDAATGTVLDTRNVSNFRNGQYLVWEVSGAVQIRVVHTGTINAVVSGVFLD
jgi:subtilisin family serine protease